MKAPLIALILMTAVPSFGKSTPRHEPTLYPVLDRDPRLAVVLSLERPPAKLGELLQTLSAESRVNVVAQGDFLGQTALVQVRGQSVREIMTQIALAAHGVWVARTGGYILVTDPSLGAAALHPPGMGLARSGLSRIVSTLNAAQLNRLRAGGTLSLADLNPEQQTWFVTAINQEVLNNLERYPRSELATHAGAMIRRTVNRSTGEEMVQLCLPEIEPDGSASPPVPFLMTRLAR